MRLIEQLLQASNLMPIGILWLDEQGRILGANGKLLQDIGFSQEELKKRSILEIDPYANIISWRRRWKSLLSGHPLKEKTELISKDGIVFPVRISYSLLEQGNQEICCASIENIQQSERYKELFQLASGIAKLGGWEWDVQQKSFFLSAEAKNLLEIRVESMQLPEDETWALLEERLSKEEKERLKSVMKTVRNSGESKEIEVVFDFAENRRKRFLIIAQAIQFDDFTTRIYGSVQDVSTVSSRSEEMYMAQVTLDNASEMIFWITPDSKVTYANNAALEKLGYSRSELIGSNIFTFSSELSKSDWKEKWSNLESQKNLEFETVYKNKSGNIFPVDMNLYYIEYENQAINCAIVRDLSFKKERDLRIKLFEFTINEFPDMALWIRADGSIRMANPAACEKLGYQEEEFLDNKIWNIIPALNEESWNSFWLSLKKIGHRTLQGVKRHKDGTLVDTEITASFLRFGKEEFVCQFGKDISDRIAQSKSLELALKTLECSKDLIFWVRQDGSFFYTNQAAREKLGYNSRELSKLTIFDLDKNYSKSQFESTWNELRDGRRIKVESEIQCKDGRKLPVEAEAYYIQYKNEEFRCSILRDISEKNKKDKELLDALEHIKKLSNQLAQEKSYLQEELNTNHDFNNIISKSEKYKPTLQKVKRVAATDATVLILGETGTGKELLARAVHNLSKRSERAMVKVNCAALPEHLIESELFGHEKGAFTGAYQQKIGRFELADTGTIFLDEIGELPFELQSKLLRVLQEGAFERLGSTKTLQVDVRVIAATNRKLEELVAEGRFREDLFYRLNVFPIYNLPLRERKEDIPLLTQHFLKRFSRKMDRKDVRISQAKMTKLQSYEFPGNIRELENIVERAVILSNGEDLNLDAILPDLKWNSMEHAKKQFLSMEELQKQHILTALKRANWKITGSHSAAELLGMNGKTLASRMRKFGIRREDFLEF